MSNVFQHGNVPKGIEVLIKKAAVDPAFRAMLLARRAAAADEIGLKLEPAEVAMINAIPTGHLKAAIRSAKVPPSQRVAFLGWDALIMLGVLAVGVGMCLPSLGHTGDRPPGVAKPEQPAEDPSPMKPVDQPANAQAEQKPTEQPKTPDSDAEQGTQH